jgi:hypothetical protein
MDLNQVWIIEIWNRKEKKKNKELVGPEFAFWPISPLSIRSPLQPADVLTAGPRPSALHPADSARPAFSAPGFESLSLLSIYQSPFQPHTPAQPWRRRFGPTRQSHIPTARTTPRPSHPGMWALPRGHPYVVPSLNGGTALSSPLRPRRNNQRFRRGRLQSSRGLWAARSSTKLTWERL